MSSIPVFGMSEFDFRNALKKIKKAIIPVGSLEQHGSHLPVSTDSLIAEYIARLVGERTGAFVLCDACASLADNRIKQIVILNGHHGNMGALQYIAQELHGGISRHVRVHTLHYWHALDHEFDHAGEVETSLVLAIAPELVRMDRAVPNSKRLSKSKAAYSSIRNSPGLFPKISDKGVWGDPRKASAEKGKKLIEKMVAGLAKTIAEFGS